MHAWTTNSTVEELLTRLILFGSDVFTLQEIHSHSEARAMEIANSRASLTTLIGGNVNIMADEPINGALFLHQQQTMLPRWRHVASAFKHMNLGLKQLKFEPPTHDPHYLPDPNRSFLYGTSKKIGMAGSVLKLGAYELQQRFMALPTLAVIYPLFRYLPNILIHFYSFTLSTF